MGIIPRFDQLPRSPIPVPEYLPNIQRIARNLRRVVKPDAAPLEHKIPSHWKEFPYEVSGQAVRCVYAPVTGKPKKAVYSALGLNDIPERHVKRAERYNNKGRPVVFMQLPLAERDPIDFPLIEKMILDFALANPPLNDELGEAKRMFEAHSTSGHYGTRLLADKHAAKELMQRMHKTTLISAFHQPKFARTAFKEAAYRAYAQRYSNHYYGEAPLDYLHGYYYRFHGYYGSKGIARPLTHGQILQATDECRPYSTALNEGSFSKHVKTSDSLQGFVGEADYVADPILWRDILGLMNAKIVSGKHWKHTPQIENSDAEMRLAEVYADAAEGVFGEHLAPPSLDHTYEPSAFA